MNPERFLAIYLEGMTGQRAAAKAEVSAAELPWLEERHYFSTQEPYRYMDNFAIDYLTRDEMLALLNQLNIDHIKNPTPGQLRAVAHGRQHVIDDLNRRLAEQEAVIAAQAPQVEALNQIYGRRAYRFYRRAVVPYKAWRLLYPLLDRLLSDPASGPRQLRALLALWRQGGSEAVKVELRRLQAAPRGRG